MPCEFAIRIDGSGKMRGQKGTRRITTVDIKAHAEIG
jgi:hypothetical protein